MADMDGIMAVMYEAQNDKTHPDWFVSDDEEYVRAHMKEHGFVIVAQAADDSVAGFFLIKYPENRADNLGIYLDFDEEQLSHIAVMDSAVVSCKGVCWKLRRDFWIRNNIIISCVPYIRIISSADTIWKVMGIKFRRQHFVMAVCQDVYC